MEQYSCLPRFYDILNDGADYDAYADFIENQVQNNLPEDKGEEIALFDLGCGTGEMSLRFCRKGWKVTAADLSDEMLTIADGKISAEHLKAVITHQDMRTFKAYTLQDVIISCFDCYNYLVNPADVEYSFRAVSAALKDDGIFIFDINTPFKYESVYADNTFFLDHDEVSCIWQNMYNCKSKMCYFDLTFFARENGAYQRFDESQRQRCWSCGFIEKKLAAAGLAIVGKYADEDVLDFIEKESRKYYYVVRKIN